MLKVLALFLPAATSHARLRGCAIGRRCIVALCLLCVLLEFQIAADESRPSHWARRIEAGEIPNLHQVNPALYRSGQPGADGFRELEKRGVRTVVNLLERSDDEAHAAGTKLRLVHIPVPVTGIGDDSMLAVLRLLSKKEDGPFLLHCQFGSDRTGAVIAMHRILFEGWTREAALLEMRKGDYGFGLEVFANYVERADLGRLRARLRETRK